MAQTDGPAGFPEEGQGWKEGQPCKNTQLKATFREAMMNVKVSYALAIEGALHTRGGLTPSGLGPTRFQLLCLKHRQQVLDTDVHPGLQLLPLPLLSKSSGLDAEVVPCWKTEVTHSCGV